MGTIDCVVAGDRVLALRGSGPWVIGEGRLLPLDGRRTVSLSRVGERVEVRDLDGEGLVHHGRSRATQMASLDECVGVGRVQLLFAQMPLLGTVRWQGMLATAPASLLQLAEIARASHAEVPVFIGGESGTGKELAARAVHEASARRGKPFVAINCAALPDTLVESELFGAEKGAYTGALQARVGAFREANGGTLFLDEVGELSPLAQAKLLRALESGEVQSVGGRAAKVDVRVVAASWRHLARGPSDGGLRHDLVHRLCVLRVGLLPLRERVADLMPLLHDLLRAKGATELMPDAELASRLERQPWTGNIRELRNCVARAIAAHDPEALMPLVELPPTEPTARPRDMMESALRHYRGNRKRAATALGVSRSTLYRWIQQGAPG